MHLITDYLPGAQPVTQISQQSTSDNALYGGCVREILLNSSRNVFSTSRLTN